MLSFYQPDIVLGPEDAVKKKKREDKQHHLCPHVAQSEVKKIDYETNYYKPR